jgi:hypothetical protein
LQVFVAALLQASLACPPGDLVFHKPVQGEQLKGFPQVVADGVLAQEGSWWEQPGSVILTKPEASLFVDLQQDTSIAALVLQGDNNDVYHVEASVDGTSWREIWAAGPVADKMGLRTRWVKLPVAQAAHYLRVHGTDGDGFFSVAELRAYCQVPTEWPPKLLEPPPLRWWNPAALWHAMTNDTMVGIKGALAGAGSLLLIWGWWLRRRGQPDNHKKLRDYLLGGMGVFALLCWWNLFHYHFDNYLHVWEHYHYYMGAKYFRELGYTRLYTCTAAAEIDQGFKERVAHRQIRNLVTNHLEGSESIVADPTQCTKYFTSQKRWEQFKADVAFFRSQVSLDTWNNSQKDHGYNGTPVWGIAGSILANLAPPGAKVLGVRYMDLLGLLDSLLLLAMWGVVLWAFGWRATCVALLYWGTNYPARYWWNGGAYLRMDWLAWSIVGICLVKKNRLAGGGAALTYAALLRIFPGFIVVGLVLKAAARMVRERKWVLSKEHWQFAKGCIAAMAVLIPLSAAVAGGGKRLGLDAWIGIKGDDGTQIEQGFVQNSAKHLHTPLTNNMGLKTIVAYQYDKRAQLTRNYGLSDPFEVWKDQRNGAFERRKILYGLMIVGFLVLLAWGAEKTDDWVALCLGAGLIPVATELTCYYYSFGIAMGLLWAKREELGVGALLVSAATCLIPAIWGWDDDRYTWMSLCYVMFAVAAAWYVGRLEHQALAAEEPAPAPPKGKLAMQRRAVSSQK